MMLKLNSFLCLCLVISVITTADAESALLELYAVAGRWASLPYNIPYASLNDTINLILWFKDNNTSPIYAFDTRKGSLEEAEHYTSLGVRAFFDIASNPPSLNLDPVYAEDDGIYKCRTDLKRSRTLKEFIRLHVIDGKAS